MFAIFCFACAAFQSLIIVEELLLVQDLCKRDIQACPVVRLQETFSGFSVVKELYPILDDFVVIFETLASDITSKIWTQVCHKMTSLQDLVNNVWQIFIGKLQDMVFNMGQLKVACREAEELMATGTASQQLQTVVKALKTCGIPVATDCDVFEVSRRVRLYGGLQAVSKEAKQLLCVIDNFQIQGDFTRVINIADVSGVHV